MIPDLLLQHFKNDSDCRDIHLHLETLREYARLCEHVTEFGFRHGASFSALVAGRPKKAITYDLHISDEDKMRFLQLDTQTEMVFFSENTLLCDIEPTDLLFIDSLHTFDQLSSELSRHADKVRAYLVFHDIQTFGTVGEDRKTPGLMAAVLNYMQTSPYSWDVEYFTPENNGLLILERK